MGKEFFFVRHGQTDHNISEGNLKLDHPFDIPLNATGRFQAENLESQVSKLPIRTICSSPMKRALETKEIICAKLQAEHHLVPALGECSAQVWDEMVKMKQSSSFTSNFTPHFIGNSAMQFFERVQAGIHHVLSLPGPALIVAHGGVHFALCHLFNIENHYWAIGNCHLAHFSLKEDGKWNAQLVIPRGTMN